MASSTCSTWKRNDFPCIGIRRRVESNEAEFLSAIAVIHQRVSAMSKKPRKPKPTVRRKAGSAIPSDASLRKDYDRACRLAERGQHDEARRLYQLLEKAVSDSGLKALIG